jgi:ubiquinone/menaquinone biosynthesis C-methylase UbiE
MGPLRGVIDAADNTGRRNLYMHTLHLQILKRELAQAGPVTRALDFGCGTGRFIQVLSRHCGHVCATDKEPSMIEAARSYAGRHAAEILCCDPANVPFNESAFDFVLCSSVLCVTIAPLIEQIVKELGRVVKTGGTLLLLEQVSEQRGLAVSRYYNALKHAGFRVLRGYPIRSAGSIFTALAASQTMISPSLFPVMARVELFITRRGVLPNSVRYTEYAIVARRN